MCGSGVDDSPILVLPRAMSAKGVAAPAGFQVLCLRPPSSNPFAIPSQSRPTNGLQAIIYLCNPGEEEEEEEDDVVVIVERVESSYTREPHGLSRPVTRLGKTRRRESEIAAPICGGRSSAELGRREGKLHGVCEMLS